ncbi:nitronate monooxygenase [Paraburkholderia sartisoli]|uniref:Nitronate monooxygenase n=1 Tax=Paraburkholderia sartisoli TaxID=83784 RepID=A0A1H4HNK1_9BURK|nr:nitronate monooxygenase [Paraburkholderia sartisoli]SEB23404.1 nitronate monooxygenase [Paraburkholderia sartisoli]
MSIQIDLTAEANDVVSTLHRPVCKLLGCTWPVALAGMGGVARSKLVGAVTGAGGFGFLGMVREPVALIREEVRRVRARTDRKFGVNLIPAATDPELLDAQIGTCIELGVPVVGLFWDVNPAVVKRLRDAGIVVVYQVGSAKDARIAEDAGAQVLIAQGREAGGHVWGDQPLAMLLPEIVAAARIPVLAAGGLVDGADVATALSFGAQGVVLGTALIPTHESFAHVYHKQRIVDAAEDATLLTDAFHINWPRGARVRVLANSVTRGQRGDPFGTESTVIGDEEGRPIYLFSTDSPLRSMTGDFEAMALYAGTGAGRIDTIVGAAERLHRIVADAAALLDSGAAPMNPAGGVHDTSLADENRDALLAALNELLEAERAGARVTSQTAAEIIAPELKQLVAGIRQDEARWCGVLTKAILSLGATPTRRTGAFHEKAMAIADLSQRMAFLNRGQGWVVRKLQALLPTLHDGRIRNDLVAMLVSHEKNIRRVEIQLSSTDDRAPSVDA